MNAADARRIITALGLEPDVKRIVATAPPLPARVAQLLAAARGGAR